MTWYPWPALIALAGWTYIFATSGAYYIAWGVATLAAGTASYLAWRVLARSGRGGAGG
jgi:hypothetical protein